MTARLSMRLWPPAPAEHHSAVQRFGGRSQPPQGDSADVGGRTLDRHAQTDVLDEKSRQSDPNGSSSGLMSSGWLWLLFCRSRHSDLMPLIGNPSPPTESRVWPLPVPTIQPPAALQSRLDDPTRYARQGTRSLRPRARQGVRPSRHTRAATRLVGQEGGTSRRTDPVATFASSHCNNNDVPAVPTRKAHLPPSQRLIPLVQYE